MSPLPSRAEVFRDWPDEIEDEAKTEMRDTVEFWLPAIKGEYDSTSDTYTGGTPAELLFESIARVQHYRSTVDAYDVDQWSNTINVRVQIPLEAGPSTFIRKGLIVRVTHSERFPKLESIALQVESAINSSAAALQTVNCVSALAEVDPLVVTP